MFELVALNLKERDTNWVSYSKFLEYNLIYPILQEPNSKSYHNHKLPTNFMNKFDESLTSNSFTIDS